MKNLDEKFEDFLNEGIFDIFKKRITEMETDLEHIREMMTQKDMVNNDGANAKYIKEINIFLKQLKDVDFKLRKGIW